ncbi:hypothetical protein ACXR2U_01840 [Jatrophihabitans sp. YIM 134969]
MVTNRIRASRAPFAVPDVDERKASVVRAVEALLQADLRADDLRALLNAALWRYTEFHAKYKFAIRYRTPAVLDSAPVTIQHEHVVQRAWLIDRITAEPDKMRGYLKLAVACVVTKDEHQQLDSPAFGWQRYVDAGLTVVDTVTMQPLDLEVAVAAQRALLNALDEPLPSGMADPDDDETLARIEALGAHRGDRDVHMAVYGALTDAGYVVPAHGGSGYVSFHDPATGTNFLNLTPTLAWLMRADLLGVLAAEPDVDTGGRHPKIRLAQPDAVATLERLARQFKR